MDILAYVIIALVLSAFFSGVEIAFLTSNKLKIELENKQNVLSARILSGFLKKPGRFIGSMLVGNNLALVFFGIMMARMLEPVMMGWGLEEWVIAILQTIISTIVILFFGEFIPKSLFRINSNWVLNVLAIPLKLLYWLLWPITILVVGISEIVIRGLFRVKADTQELAFTRVDLHNYVREMTEFAEKSEDSIDHEIQIFQNALDFSKVKARDCMVPRTEITAIAIDEEVSKLKAMFIETGYSRILVYRENIDNIIGFVNSAELFNKPDSIRHLIIPVVIIPETMSAKEVLEQFIKLNKSIAVVVDEYGGTSGILTIEDIIEQIFGDIEDEHDTDDLLEEKIDGNSYNFAARLEINYINSKYKLNLPESDEYETLGGLIIHHHESIPEAHEVIEIQTFQFQITAVSNVRIETVNLRLLQAE